MTSFKHDNTNLNEKPNSDSNSASSDIFADMQSRIQKKAKRGPAKKLNQDSRNAAVQLYLSGEYSLQAVGNYFNVSLETIRSYVKEHQKMKGTE